MTSIGQTLADARRKRKVSVKDVEKAIKVRAKYILALEKDAFDEIPGEAYVVGFLKTYAQWLNIDSKPLIAKYKDRFDVKRGNNHSDSINSNDTTGKFDTLKRLLPVLVILAIIVLAGLKLIGSRGY